MSIWQYQKHFTPHVNENNQLTLGEGQTPLLKAPGLANKLGIPELYLKREDLNPTGSHKDRGIAFQLSAHIEQGHNEFVISSSGNAAISAINYCQLTQAKLHIFLSPKLEKTKLARLQKALKIDKPITPQRSTQQINNFYIHFTNKAVSAAFQLAKEKHIILLRGSTDQYAIEGYQTLGFEIAKQQSELDQLFIPISSGTAVVGIYKALTTLKQQGDIPKIPQLHIVQTTKVNPIARQFDSDYIPEANSVAPAITDRIAHRLSEVTRLVRDSGGSGWVVENKTIKYFTHMLHQHEVLCSPEGGMALAGIAKASKADWPLNKVACIITGTQ